MGQEKDFSTDLGCFFYLVSNIGQGLYTDVLQESNTIFTLPKPQIQTAL